MIKILAVFSSSSCTVSSTDEVRRRSLLLRVAVSSAAYVRLMTAAVPEADRTVTSSLMVVASVYPRMTLHYEKNLCIYIKIESFGAETQLKMLTHPQ